MKSRKLILCILFLFPFILFLSEYIVFRFWDTCNIRVLDSVILQNGDLVLRRGISIESFAVVKAEKNSYFSHIGLIIMERGKPYVIHAEPGESPFKNDPVKKEPLRYFLQTGKASHFAIYRSHLDQKGLNRVIAQARLFYLQKCRFDNNYDLTTDHNLYCSELILKSYRQGNQSINSLLRQLEEVNIVLVRKKILMPGAFINSSLFYKICSR